MEGFHIKTSELETYLDKKISVHVATWGLQDGKLPLHSYGQAVPLTLADFLVYYYGFVAAS